MDIVSFDRGLESIQSDFPPERTEHLPLTEFVPDGRTVENHTESLYKPESLSHTLFEELVGSSPPIGSALSAQAFHQLCHSTLMGLKNLAPTGEKADPVVARATSVLESLDADRNTLLTQMRMLSRG